VKQERSKQTDILDSFLKEIAGHTYKWKAFKTHWVEENNPFQMGLGLVLPPKTARKRPLEPAWI